MQKCFRCYASINSSLTIGYSWPSYVVLLRDWSGWTSTSGWWPTSICSTFRFNFVVYASSCISSHAFDHLVTDWSTAMQDDHILRTGISRKLLRRSLPNTAKWTCWSHCFFCRGRELLVLFRGIRARQNSLVWYRAASRSVHFHGFRMGNLCKCRDTFAKLLVYGQSRIAWMFHITRKAVFPMALGILWSRHQKTLSIFVMPLILFVMWLAGCITSKKNVTAVLK